MTVVRHEHDGVWTYDDDQIIRDRDWPYVSRYGDGEPYPIMVHPYLMVAQHAGTCVHCRGELKGTLMLYSPGKGYFNKHLTCAADQLEEPYRTAWLRAHLVARDCRELGAS